ncbi:MULTISPECIES: type II toxin-antitoxin system ParD family antitoxin [unclassified Endozoicomonas]|uniref:type II toxin-antitoxin system ParD family antitoxin n=1 Tax=unclassified Endozoicomonas TaxID=2644528 RepID=UPI0021485722|nr:MULTISPECIES: type II toxin-antitoxin system ParD family antitoxin [unclassified Endozoicomonas]
MPRQSITFTEPNDKWLKAQVDSKEYSSKSDVINDLIRQARSRKSELEAIRDALIKGENSGISELTPEDIVARYLSENVKMASYKLSNEAALDIERILEFGIDNFGLDQALHYHDSL